MRRRDSFSADPTPDFTITPLTPTQVTRARSYVASQAHDADDARRLLAALGIGPAAGGSPYVTTRRGLVHREPCRYLRPIVERWAWFPALDGPGVARPCRWCVGDELPGGGG